MISAGFATPKKTGSKVAFNWTVHGHYLTEYLKVCGYQVNRGPTQDTLVLSAVAPSFDDRGKRYTKKMRSLLACDGNYILESHYYEVDRGMNPPACISDELRKEIYGEDFTIRELDVNRLGEDPNRKLSFAFDVHYHLFKPKAN